MESEDKSPLKKGNLAMCTMFRNEAPYLLEWISYHVSLGFDHFYLYNHLSTDDFEEVLTPLIQKGVVTLKNSTGYQGMVFNDCMSNYKSKTKWMANMDLDEYVALSPKLNRTTLLSFMEQMARETNADSMYLKRHHFTTNGHERALWKEYLDAENTRKKLDPSCPLLTCNYLQRNTKKHVAGLHAGKMVFTPSHLKYFAGHNLVGNITLVNARGENVVPEFLPRIHAPAVVHHYVTLSLEECQAKKVSSAYGGGWRNKSGDAWCERQHQYSATFNYKSVVKDTSLLRTGVRTMRHMCWLHPQRALAQGVPCQQLEPLKSEQVGREEGNAFMPLMPHMQELGEEIEEQVEEEWS
jgi:hypothetical protein